MAVRLKLMNQSPINIYRKTIKYMLRSLLLEYPKDSRIENRNTLNQVLANLVWKATVDSFQYSPRLVYALLNFFESRIIRGVLYPETVTELALELVQILEKTYQ